MLKEKGREYLQGVIDAHNEIAGMFESAFRQLRENDMQLMHDLGFARVVSSIRKRAEALEASMADVPSDTKH